MKLFKKISILLAAICVLLSVCCACTVQKGKDEVIIGIAWRADTDSEFYTNITKTLDDMNVKYKLLDRVILSTIEYDGTNVDESLVSEHGYLEQSAADIVKTAKTEDSNVATVMKGISGVIFTGGEDISPTLYKDPQPWHGIEDEKDYNCTRDVSDYLLLSYCIEKDVPTMGLCRGMQMLGVVCGATVIQDIPTFFEDMSITYDYTHRNNKATPDSYRDYAPHDVTVTNTGSLLYDIAGLTVVADAPSWHHQALLSVENTKLKVTGITETCGVDMIEAIEYTGNKCNIGFQFHPEAAVAKNLDNAQNCSDYMTKAQAERFFEVFVGYCK